MANNRLYLYDPDSHEAFMLAKSDGEGWSVSAPGPMTQSFDERLYHDHFALRLMAWLDGRDLGASLGNGREPTMLRLCTEADLPPDAQLPTSEEPSS